MSVNAYQPVLDPASSGRMFWFDKHDTRVLFGDIRDESWELCDGRRFDVKPDMEMDYRDLPFPDGTFRMVVLDRLHGEEIRCLGPGDVAGGFAPHVP